MAEDFLVRDIREEGIKNAADRLVEDMAKTFGRKAQQAAPPQLTVIEGGAVA